jgi:hypothetical protein
MQMAIVEVIRNAESMCISLFHVMYSRYFHDPRADVVRASSPDSAVASPYDGIRNGSSVIMKMPNPNPVVRCTKLAPTARRKIPVMFCI